MKTKISSLIILSAFICLSVGSGQAALRRDPISKKKMGKYEIFLTYGKIENRSDFEVKVGKERGKKVNKNVFVRTNKVKINIFVLAGSGKSILNLSFTIELHLKTSFSLSICHSPPSCLSYIEITLP